MEGRPDAVTRIRAEPDVSRWVVISSGFGQRPARSRMEVLRVGRRGRVQPPREMTSQGQITDSKRPLFLGQEHARTFGTARPLNVTSVAAGDQRDSVRIGRRPCQIFRHEQRSIFRGRCDPTTPQFSFHDSPHLWSRKTWREPSGQRVHDHERINESRDHQRGGLASAAVAIAPLTSRIVKLNALIRILIGITRGKLQIVHGFTPYSSLMLWHSQFLAHLIARSGGIFANQGLGGVWT